MMKNQIWYWCFVFCCSTLVCSAQNETKKWYFGYGAGLDFMTSPPTSINGSLSALEGCASISDAAGNLLFYTDGILIYNKTHALMANGSGLMGNPSSSQSAIIVKKPGSASLYYVFTVDCWAQPNGLRYSVVDMSLAAGMGSVTIKNFPLHTPSTEKIAATKHCNGKDIWVTSHDYTVNVYRSYLVTASGISTVAVTSTAGSPHTSFEGYMKFSPNGLKIACAVHFPEFPDPAFFEISNFDNSTGMVSNPLTFTTPLGPYGCEFSPDGSKFYGANWQDNSIYQWDLCAGSASAVQASKFQLAGTTTTQARGAMQLGPDGKIYHVLAGLSSLDVINNPNLAGAACGYSPAALSLGTPSCGFGLPAFVAGPMTLPPFTFSLSCQNASFTSHPVFSSTAMSCIAPGAQSRKWTFGDPGSGAANTSTLLNPQHSFSGPGVYTVTLKMNGACANDSVIQTITVSGVPAPVFTASPASFCVGGSAKLSISGVSTYTLLNGVSTPTSMVTPSATTTYTLLSTNPDGSCLFTSTLQLKVESCIGIGEENSTEGLKVYPNPIENILIVEAKTKAELKIYSITGKLVFVQALESGLHTLDLGFLRQGLYSLVIISHADTRMIRVVKEK